MLPAEGLRDHTRRYRMPHPPARAVSRTLRAAQQQHEDREDQTGGRREVRIGHDA